MTADCVFTVQADRKGGIVTDRCPTSRWALTKMDDFVKAGYTGVRVLGPDGERVTVAELESLVAGVAPPTPALAS